MINHPPLCFNQNIQQTFQKHWGMFLDNKLNFSKHLKIIFQKTDNTLGHIPKLHTRLPRSPLIAICKSFYQTPLELWRHDI